MIDRILDFAVQRRWLVLLLTLLAAGFGLYAATRLPIDAVPDITNNQVQINTIAPSLSPVDIEKQVTYPIEAALAGIKGLDYTRSLSRNGFSQVTAVFAEKLDIYFARQQVAERLAQVARDLPPGAQAAMGPISTGLGEIVMWSVRFAEAGARRPAAAGKPGWQEDGSYRTPEGQRLTGDLERKAYLRTVQDWIVRPQIRTVPGVAGVDSIGGFEKQYHVQPDPTVLASLDLSFADVARALEANNANQGARYLEDNGESYVVRAAGRLEGMADIGNVVVATRGGVPVRISDVASVRIGRDLRTGSGSEDGAEAVIGTALMLIGENSRTVAEAVTARMDAIRRSLPPGIEIRIVLDRTQLVEATVRTVGRNLSEGALLVVVILFLLLGNIRAALVTALVIPVAMLMTMTGMVEAKISANLMSLGALDFGLIVDGAVIISENALRHVAERQHALGRPLALEERLDTVRDSAREMIAPSLYGQAIIILVYVPLLTFTGVEGKMFEPMALTVIIALACAFVLSLTFVPALLAIVLTGRVSETDNALVRGMKAAYRPVLDAAIRAPFAFAVFALALLAGAGILATRLGTEFIPQLDEEAIALNATRIPSTSLTQSQAMQLKVEKAVLAFPEVATVFSKTGTAEVASDPMPPNSSDTFVILKPRGQWPDPALPKAEPAGADRDGGRAARGQRLRVLAADPAPLQRVARGHPRRPRGEGVRRRVRAPARHGEPHRRDPARHRGRRGREGRADRGPAHPRHHDRQGRGRPLRPQHRGDPGRDRRRHRRARGRGGVRGRPPLPHRHAPHRPGPRGPRDAGEHPRAPAARRRGEGGLGPAQAGRVLLRHRGPNQISRENGRRRVVVTANVRGRDIGSVVAEAQARVGREVSLPAGSSLTWGGQFENLASAKRRLAAVVPACFLLILLLLGSALGSVRDALLVFSAVPLALTGGILALWLRDMPVSVPAAVGFIALSGVAVLNGLVMISAIRHLAAGGLPLREAIREGAATRLRPVAMTALVASLGFVPMALATGTGAEIQRPLATVVIGGLISATLLTLVVLPGLYARFGRPPVAKRSAESEQQERLVEGDKGVGDRNPQVFPNLR